MKRLTSKEFKAAIKFVPGMEQANIDAARYVLVDGLSYGEAATKLGGTRQWVQKKVDRIYNAFLENHTDCPAGWYRITVCLPSNKAVSEIQKLEKQFTRDAKLKEKQG